MPDFRDVLANGGVSPVALEATTRGTSGDGAAPRDTYTDTVMNNAIPPAPTPILVETTPS